MAEHKRKTPFPFHAIGRPSDRSALMAAMGELVPFEAKKKKQKSPDEQLCTMRLKDRANAEVRKAVSLEALRIAGDLLERCASGELVLSNDLIASQAADVREAIASAMLLNAVNKDAASSNYKLAMELPEGCIPIDELSAKS